MLRVSVDLTPRQLALLESLMKRSGRSKADVFRDALSFMADACADKDAGFRVGAWQDDQRRGLRTERSYRVY
jgi:hypothetical protein